MSENLPALSTIPTSKTAWSEYRLSHPDFKFRIFHSVHDLDEDWAKAQPPANAYLHTPYLTALEEAPPQRMRLGYLVFYQKDLPTGVAYLQVSNFKTEQSVQDMEGDSSAPGFIRTLGSKVKNFVAKQFEYNLLVCGNLLLTGEHGFYFEPGSISRSDAMNVLEEALQMAQVHWRERKLNIDGIFIKDIDKEAEACKQRLLAHKFREFTFHPNMVLYIRPEWNSFDDYMQAISSKYRVRARKAFKLGQGLKKVDFTEEMLRTNVTRLYELYQKVLDNAGFNMVTLHENYIVQLKRQMGDNFHVTGYYLDGELVGYRTNIHNFDEIEAHFLGYEPDCNKHCQLYMNMLLDSLRYGIEHQTKRVVYARTAMEIKSSIGAVPEELFCYIRANGKLLNTMLGPLLEYFRPPDDWVQRNPFKD